MISIVIGQIIFPIAGWLLAQTHSLTDYASATAFMSNYCFGSIAFIGLAIVTADYFSTNDSSLFGSVAAIEGIWSLKHMVSVGIVAGVGALAAALFSATDMSQALSTLLSLNCIILPTPTVIMICEWYLRKKVMPTNGFTSVPPINELPQICWPACIALLAGFCIGIVTSGLIPAFEIFHIGVCSLQAWLTSIIVYIPLRLYSLSSTKNNYAGNFR